MLKLDTHTHSVFSDGLPSIPDIEDACLRRGFAVALTDHNEIRGSVLLAERARVPTVPAIEVGTQAGLEFLVYFGDPVTLEEFYTRAVEPHLLSRFMVRSKICALECLEIARDLNGFISLAHPFAPGRKSIRRHGGTSHKPTGGGRDIIERIDAVELFNAGIPRKANRLASSFASSTQKKTTIGSDAHAIGQ
jgi:predicted metal-dependent phosphoesterase TrpH